MNDTITRKKYYDNDKKLNITDTVCSVLQFAVVVILLISINSGNTQLNTLAFLAGLVFCIFAPLKFGVLFLFCISIFESSFTFEGDCGWFFIAAVVIAKCLFIKKKRTFKIRYLVPVAVIFCLEMITELIFHGFDGEYLVVLVLIALTYFLFADDNMFGITPKLAFFVFGSVFFAMTIYLFYQYGGMMAFVDKFISEQSIERLGLEYRKEIDGAMGLPIFSLLVVSMSVPILMYYKKSILEKIVIVFLDGLALLVGCLTVSRSFIFGLLVIALCLIFFKGAKSKGMNTKWLLIVFLVLAAVVASALFSDLLISIVGKFDYRIVNDTTGGTGHRLQIFVSCFDYLGDHFLALIFGQGACGYQDLGHAYGYAFSAGCHNYFIDILMSFGLIGTVASVALVVNIVKKENLAPIIKKMPFSLVPLLAIVSFSLTAMRTNSIKPVIYLFIAYVFIKYNKKAVMSGEENDT